MLSKKLLKQQIGLILASGSPRRRDIFEIAGFSVDIIPSTFEENLDKSKYTPSEYVMENSRQKALEVQRRMKLTNDNSCVIVGADTVVVDNNKILEKPKSHDEAFAMLQQLNGSNHFVITGVTLLNGSKFSHTFYESTDVSFAVLDDDTIRDYILTNEPFDKAGGYGMQGLAAPFVKSINGCYYNVVGFPIYKFCEQIESLLFVYIIKF